MRKTILSQRLDSSRWLYLNNQMDICNLVLHYNFRNYDALIVLISKHNNMSFDCIQWFQSRFSSELYIFRPRQVSDLIVLF